MTAFGRASRARPRTPPARLLRRSRPEGGEVAAERPGGDFSLASVPARPPILVGAAGDPAEAEADRAADGLLWGEAVRMRPAATPVVRREAAARGGEAPFGAPAAGGGYEAPPVVHDVLARSGEPLDPALRSRFESRFGTSLAGVRIHADAEAGVAARAIGARAFTLGRHIGFSAGEYDPETSDGRRLVAHELAHVVQEAAGDLPGIVRREPYRTGPVEIERADIVSITGASYWVARTTERYSITGQSARMAQDRQEQDAVLATLWARNPPAAVASQRKETVTVQPPPAAGAGGALPPALIYEFQFDPPAPGDPKPRFSATFVRQARKGDPAATPLAPEAHSRNRLHFELEKLRDPSRPPADRLGAISMPPGLAAAEQEAIAFAVYGYFGPGAARDKDEVDAIIPLAAAGRSLMVTLRFGANNDVDVKLIGAPGTGAGQVNVNRIDLVRVNGFPGAAESDSKLRTWWRKRYKGGGTLATPVAAPATGPVAPGGPAPASSGNAALIAEMTRLIEAGSTTRQWFKDNYELEVLTQTDARTLLSRLDPDRAPLVADTLDFKGSELTMLELALQLLGPHELNHLKKVKLVRKATGVEMVGGRWQPSAANAVAFKPGRDRIIIYFDRAYAADPWLFRGSDAANALTASTMTTVHEFGHTIARSGGIQAAFNAWESRNRQTPPTDHAARNRQELFAEFYGLFRTDPEYLCRTAPLVFSWFDVLTRTGKPPRAGATLPSAACPP